MKKTLSTKILHSFLRISLIPVARFCLRHSLKLQDVQQAMREVLVSEAIESLKQDQIEVSGSKIALITGVHRKHVASIQNEDPKESLHTDLMTKVLGQWQVDKQFSRAGIPKPLTCVGKESQFVELVRKVSKEMNPYSVLFELERIGLVKKEGSTVIAQAKEFVPAGNAEQIFSMYQEDGSDLIAAVEENAIGNESKHFHIRTAFDNIPLKDLAEIRSWIFSEGEKFHKRAREKLSRYDRDTTKAKVSEANTTTAKVSVTLFEYSAEVKKEK